jgi:hypothetical protein
MGPAFALLFCLTSRTGFYDRLGFARIPVPVFVEQLESMAEMPLHTMWRPLAPDATWPAGPVVLRSLPF